MTEPSRHRSDITDEIEFHLDEVIDGLVARGWTRDDARREAQRRFGDRRRYGRRLEQIQRETRPGGRMQLEHLWLDLRYAFRSLRAAPAFTLAAMLVLTLGMAATTAIYSMVDVVVLRGLPYPESGRLMAVGERRVGMRANNDPDGLIRISQPNFLGVARDQHVFSALGITTPAAMAFEPDGGDPEDLNGARVTAGFFDALGVAPALGRAFTAENEVDGRNRVAVLGDGLWHTSFGGDPAIVGRTVRLDGVLYQVLGIMPPGFSYPPGAPRPVDAWMPYVMPGPAATSFEAIGRLAPGVTAAQAAAAIAQLSDVYQAQFPARNKNVTVATRSLQTNLVGADVSNWMWMLLSIAGCVLVIACANTAGLCLARGASRARELSIRAALGSGRARIVRQLVIESLLLSVASTALAVVAAKWIVAGIRRSLPAMIARTGDIAVDMRVLAIVAAASVLTALVFGGLPAVRASRTDLASPLMGSRGSVGGGRHHLRRGLIIAEVALAVVLLVSAALFAGSFAEARRIDPGLQSDHVLVVQLAPRVEPGQPPPDLRVAYAGIVERVAASPGVIHTGMIFGGTPFGGVNTRTALVSESTPPEGKPVSFRRVTPDYFATLRIVLRRGRFFDDGDREGRPRVAIVNETAARSYFPDKNALGASIVLAKQPYTVVGVIADVQQNHFTNRVSAEAFVPVAFGAAARGDLLVHTAGDPMNALPAVRAAVRAELPGVPVRDVRTLDAMRSQQFAEFRLDTMLVTLFALAGMTISAVGLYGLLTHIVAERSREIGVRMALGASRGSAIRLVVRQAGVLVLAGLALGAVASRLLAKTMAAFVFHVDPGDLRALAIATALLAIVAMAAIVFPARRAASVEPLEALRTE